MILERFSMLGIAVVAVGASTVLYTNVAARTVRALPTGLARRVRPALWIAPAALVVSVVLIYPAAATVVLSTFDADGGGFVGLRNYTDLLSKPSTLVALRNSLMWVIGLPLLGAALGLIVAVLTDRVRYGPWVKAALFVPIAVSAVATAVIWRFFYEYKPAGTAQTGTLNELVTRLGVGPVPWLIDGWVNNPALIATAVWTQTGLCAVIFAAALRGVSVDLYEAASLDGASPWHQFRHITLPLIWPTVVVVLTTMAVIALKAFDVIYVMTNGSYDTDVLATLMYKELFSARDDGRSGALATLLMLSVAPIVWFNVRHYRSSLRGMR
ncbi:MAG: sugar ABC transporter permease [Actinomycetota bacterium]|nr:sugar ABC transporter permease [Actinomycetota bacterium]